MKTVSTAQSETVEILKMHIGGQWVESEKGEVFEAINPATGKAFAVVQKGTRADAARAVKVANDARESITKLSIWDRSKLCLAVADVMEERKEELARTLSEDQGKPYFTEAGLEVEVAVRGFRNAAEHVKWLETSYIPMENPRKRAFSIRQPRGVYAIVTPWNFPLNIPIEYLGPGLATGNTMVWVPAPSTSVIAIRLMECIEAAGVPPGVINLVTGLGPVVGDEIVAHPGTDAIGFTGSAATGLQIAKRAAGKPQLMELGGNGPVIILDDADIGAAIEATAMGCFRNAGQICSSSERVLVQEKIHDEFTEGMIKAARQVRLGDPFSSETTMGPLNNPDVAQKVALHVQDGQKKGAEVQYGGKARPDLGSDFFYEPTVLTNVTRDSLLNLEETFGPVVPLIQVKTEDEILTIANSNELGLTSSVFTKDIKRAFRFAENIKTGIVNINGTSNYWELHVPFGGMSGKRSGVGRIGGHHTLMEMTDIKTLIIDIG